MSYLNKKCAFVWIVTEQVFAEEAISSSYSVMRNMPDIDRILFVPTDIDPSRTETFTQVRHFFYPKEVQWYKVAAHHFLEILRTLKLEDYRKLIFIDSDIYFGAPIYDVFNLLEDFDVAMAHAPGRRTAGSIYGLTNAFPELNGGLIAVNVNQPVTQLFYNWNELLEQNQGIYATDQGALTDAIWMKFHTDVRLIVLPPEYNCRFHFPCAVCGPVVVLHGHTQDPEGTLAKINADLGMRSWKAGEMG